jgi:cytosine/uracil/thiamine/allantoin permease
MKTTQNKIAFAAVVRLVFGIVGSFITALMPNPDTLS